MAEHSSCEITIDLHGLTVEDALRKLHGPLYSTRFRSIRVIHGRGSGALKNAVRDFLRDCGLPLQVIYGEDLNLPGRDGITLVYK
mgnify:CR=1 FL=1|jgi:DNA-nicking Smr family endonuclease